jgi:hypothetical protein
MATCAKPIAPGVYVRDDGATRAVTLVIEDGRSVVQYSDASTTPPRFRPFVRGSASPPHSRTKERPMASLDTFRRQRRGQPLDFAMDREVVRRIMCVEDRGGIAYAWSAFNWGRFGGSYGTPDGDAFASSLLAECHTRIIL